MTAVQTQPAPVRIERAAPRLTFGGVLRSELGKPLSLRSTRISGALVVLLFAAGMALRALSFVQLQRNGVHLAAGESWNSTLDVGTTLGELAAVVFAVLVVGSEYAGRAVLATFVATPRRLLVLGAKAIAAAVEVAALTIAGILLGALVSLPLMASAGVGAPPVAFAGAAAASAALVVLLALFAVGVTALVRSTAGGTTIVLLVLLLLPLTAALLGVIARFDVTPLLLTYAAPVVTGALAAPVPAGQLLGSAAVTAAWLLVPGAAGALLLVRRDV